jgi:L-threonylcarbamoyladenylate synthase
LLPIELPIYQLFCPSGYRLTSLPAHRLVDFIFYSELLNSLILKPQIAKINPQNPEPDIIAEAATIIKNGGVVVFPTHCLYGLGADAHDPDAVEKIIRIKQRPADNPILVLIHCRRQLDSLAAHISPAAAAIMAAFWPGRVTLVFKSRAALPESLTVRSGKIGVRLAGHPVAAALAKQVGSPVTGTSANLSGRPGCHRVESLDPAITGGVDLVLDAGRLEGGAGSTVVDVTVEPPRVLREGQVGAAELWRTLAAI